MSTRPPTSENAKGPEFRGNRARAWSILILVAGLALLVRDAATPEALVGATPSEPDPIEAPVAPPAPASPFEIHFTSPPAADGSARALLGTVRVETDDGTLVRELEVRGETLAVLDVPAGPYVIRAHVAGFAQVTRAIRTPRETLEIALEPIARVAGQIHGPDGLPHVATVRIVGSGIWPGREVMADAEGHFVFENVPSGVYEVEASSDALVAEPRRGLTVDPEASVFVGLRLAEGGFVTGQIVDRVGHAVAGAEIVASVGAISTSSRATLSDASGSFRVGPFTVGAVSVDVRASAFVHAIAQPCRTDAPCRIALSEGATLRGRVLDASREPLANAWVEVIGDASDRSPIAVSATVLPLAPLLFAPTTSAPSDSALPALPTLEVSPDPLAMPGLGTTDEVPPIPLAVGEIPEITLSPGGVGSGGEGPMAPAPTQVVHTSLRTNEDGEFVVTGLPPGRVEVIARAPGHRAGRSPRLQLTAGRTREDVELVLEEGGHVTGHVMDEHGRAADARIEARIENDPVPRYFVTDARGAFRLEDVGGTVLLFVASDDRPTLERIVDVRGGRTEDLAITLDAGRRTVRAVVLDPQGDPVEDALVRIETMAAGTGQPRTLVTDANGEIELTAAPPGLLSLEASHPRYTSSPVILRDEQRVTLTLAEPFSVQTTLLDAWTGAAIGDAEITWTCLDADPCHRTSASTAEGIVELLRARASRYRIDVRASGYAPRTYDMELRAPRRGDVLELDPFVIEPGLRVSGDVVDPFGRVVSSAEVSIAASDTRDALRAITDDRGHFEIVGVPSGRRTVVVEHASAGPETRTLEVRRDRDPAPFVIHLPARFDDEATHGDRARRVIGVGIALDDATTSVARVITPGARRAGLIEGDVIVAVDGVAASDPAGAALRLRGAAFLPSLLEVRRGSRTFFVRAPRELHESAR